MDSVCVGMNHGRSALTGLVGIHRAGDTLTDSCLNCIANRTTGSSGGSKGTLENGGKHSRNRRDVHNNHDDTAKQIQYAHKGNQTRGELCNARNTLPDDIQQKCGVKQDKYNLVESKGFIQRFCNVIGLRATQEL